MHNIQCNNTVQVKQCTYQQMHLITVMNCTLLSAFIGADTDCNNTHSMKYKGNDITINLECVHTFSSK
jgi:hypothetical protein